ncbi:phosphate/phosphite/phosphonate ABC transporter substrate-binding protein [Pseudooceanicola sp. 200-1SW]|uniref:phosphate/phosphite/phosphonate ABC transporter substrate-binding protein n=1 Tax=Pseudooceanicola sp. 200-1SW TaxID=3425949 RepID=UPI003D7FA97A
MSAPAAVPQSRIPPLAVAFPMYERAATAPIYDQLWQHLRPELAAALPDLAADLPQALWRGQVDLFDLWQAPDLLLAQTCGLPFRGPLKGKVTLVGTTDPALPDTPPGHYRSVIVTRAEDPARAMADLDGRPAAANEAVSQSGWAALCDHAQAAGIRLGPVTFTGAHVHAVEAVAEGRADLASIDLITWNLLLSEGLPAARALKVIEITRPTPAHPIITAPGRDPAPLAAALSRALAQLPASARQAIGFTRLLPPDPAQYFAIPLPPAPACDLLS